MTPDISEIPQVSIDDFFDWALAHVSAVVAVDHAEKILSVAKQGRLEPIPVYFAQSEWNDFVAWFRFAEGVGTDKSDESLFDLLEGYLEQGVYQWSEVQTLALFDHGIWPEQWRDNPSS